MSQIILSRVQIPIIILPIQRRGSRSSKKIGVREEIINF
jgi:hypothetical protein